MNYQRTNKAGTILLTAGITIILCTLFFILFGTKIIINTAYLEPTTVVQETDTDEDDTDENSTDNSSKNTSGAASVSQNTTVKMQEEQTEKETTTDAAKISIPGLTEMTIKSGSKTADVDLYNPGKNDCYFKITISLDDGTVLYQSDYVRPGQHIYEITLKKALKKGEYSAVLHYDAYSTDGSYTEYNGADVPFTLIAE